MINTPILLNIFNRPDTTKKVFEVIRKIKPTRLYISADGPRTNLINEYEICKKTREITENVDWNCEVYRNYSDQNLGCKIRISSAIDWFFRYEEMGIILEDDCLPEEIFFQFCEEMLLKYKDNKSIGMITGQNLSFGKISVESDYFFSRYSNIWGWATWKRSWDKYDVAIGSWKEKKNKEKIKKLFPQIKSRIYWFDIFNQLYRKRIDTWDYQWSYACWINNLLQIVPSKNLISNIGFGEGATHSKKISQIANMKTEKLSFPLKHPGAIVVNEKYDEILRRNNYPFFRYFARQYINRIKKILNI